MGRLRRTVAALIDSPEFDTGEHLEEGEMTDRNALLVIDMQKALLNGDRPAHDVDGVRSRVALLVDRARRSGTPLIYIQHDGYDDSPLAVGSVGWQIDDAVAPLASEPVLHKKAADAFFRTPLAELLKDLAITRLIVVGCKTQFCIDTTVRAATSRGYHVTLVADAHTTTDSDALTARQIIAHHNETLDDFGNDDHEVRLATAETVELPGK
jgi:nicotinamidase-related amidase